MRHMLYLMALLLSVMPMMTACAVDCADLSEDARTVDSDGDGATDYVECAAGNNPNDPSDIDDDGDQDGMSNVEEIEYGHNLNPRDADTDNDGLLDGEEVYELGTLPYTPNSDGGECDDGYEVSVGTDPNDPTDDSCPEAGE